MNKTICSLAMLLTSLVAVSAFAAGTDCKSETNYPLITKSELSTLVQSKGVFVIDVNSKESFDKAHVPGAIHFESHEKDFATVLPQDKNAEIVAYCGGPQCTAWKKAAEQACKMGYTNIHHFKGGISGWTAKDKS
jgi:rhodanese-related sulfurtransferase